MQANLLLLQKSRQRHTFLNSGQSKRVIFLKQFFSYKLTHFLPKYNWKDFREGISFKLLPINKIISIQKQKIMIKSNKIINNSLSMLKNSDNLTTRKKLEDYSYCLGHNIGKGYSSHVYKGRNDLSDETVAIKVIDMRMLKGEVHRNLLASQIEVLKTFKYSKNIIQVFDIYTTKNNTYIITEFCEGGDLSKMIAGKRGMPESQAISIIKQVIDGYSEISSNRIIHRDLKPANILLKNNHIKIADFGFAMKASDSKKYSSYNVGSPIYMPPEALNDNKYSFKSDIWAIGVIFYELLTGKTPWRAKTEKELGRQLLSVPIDRLLPKNISDVSAEFLKKSLAMNYDRRMNPDELFAFKFDSHHMMSQLKTTSQISGNGTQTSIKNSFKDIENKKRQTSLSKNTINTPKNLDRFNFMRNGNTHANLDENKNLSLPKTASTIHNRTHTALQTNTTINTAQNIKVTIDRKQISKELLSQIHLCRFVYKLLQRIQQHLENAYGVNQLQSSMKGLIFQKLTDVLELNCMNDEKKAREYKKTQDYQKISQIIDQYQKKYEKDLGDTSDKWNGLSRMDSELGQSIKQLYGQIKSLESLNEGKEKVIILDYLITLKQLGNLLEKNDIEIFHEKSKIEAIVEGAPAKNITNEHVRAISAKLKAIKLL